MANHNQRRFRARWLKKMGAFQARDEDDSRAVRETIPENGRNPKMTQSKGQIKSSGRSHIRHVKDQQFQVGAILTHPPWRSGRTWVKKSPNK